MQRIGSPPRPLALHGPERSRDIEQRAQARLPPHTLMHRASTAVARLALALAPHAQKVWIAAGAGNNGGDGLGAAIALLRAGKQVQVTLLGDAAKLPVDARDAYSRAQAEGVVIGTQPPATLSPQDLGVDALLGLGACRAPLGRMAELIATLNAVPCPVLAVDLPSGLDAFTGRPLGDSCVRARHTLCLLTLKPGLYTAQGRDHAGDVWFDDLGVDSSNTAPDAWLSSASQTARAQRAHAQHKGNFGNVAVVGGAPGMTGAALLAAHAALAAGAGRVYVSLLDGNDKTAAMTLDSTRPELMFRPAWWLNAPDVIAHCTVVCGCGGGDAARTVLPPLLSNAQRLVLDADALNAVAADSALQRQLQARAARGLLTVLTPHPLEAARLLDGSVADVQANRLHSAQALSERYRSVVLLKGSGSVIAAPGCVPHINATGNAALATPGTGDVLAGWLGGLWAPDVDGAPPEHELAFNVAVSAAYLHGAAADSAGVTPIRAADLVERLLQPGCS